MNWWLKFGCKLTGWSSEVLAQCSEASRCQLSKYTSALIILILIWSVTGFCFAQRYIELPFWGCCLVSVFFITIVIMIERQIILTTEKWFSMLAFRVIIALVMAIVGSTIFDQTMFGKDIDKCTRYELIDGATQLQCDWKQETPHHGTKGSQEGAEQILKDDQTEAWSQAAASLRNACSYQDSHKNGRNGFQGTDEHDAEDADCRPMRHGQSENGTNQETNKDAEHETHLTPFAENSTHSPLLFYII